MQDKDKKDLGLSFIETLRSSELSDVSQDFLEMAVDDFLEEGIAKEMPIISTLLRLGKTAVTIRDYFLIRKVLEFLAGLKDISPKEKEDFLRKIQTNKKFERRVGETVMMLLDRYDHLDKPRLMSTLFGAYIREEIDFDEFQWFSTVLDRVFMQDLNYLLNYFSGNSLLVDINSLSKRLYGSGLSILRVAASVDQDRGFLIASRDMWTEGDLVSFRLTQEAIKMARIILGEKFEYTGDELPKYLFD